MNTISALSGSWRTARGAFQRPLSLCAVCLLLTLAPAMSQAVEVSLPAIEIAAGETARVPVTVSGVPTDAEILSLNADLRFDASVLSPGGIDADRRGSLTSSWSLAANARLLPGATAADGQLLLAGATASAAVHTDGTLLFIDITVPDDAVAGASSPLRFELLFFNNGDPPVTTVDGLVTIIAPRLKADFSGHPLEGPAPLEVRFEDLSSEGVTAWTWDFGDGSGSDGQTPSHVYEQAGSYTVSLTVTAPTGTATETKPAYVSVSPDVQPPAIVEGPVAEGATHNSVTIRYKTNEAGDTEVQYCGLRFRPTLGSVAELWRGLADDLDVNDDRAGELVQSGALAHFDDDARRWTLSCGRYFDEDPVLDHSALLEGLPPSTFFVYRARSSDAAGNPSHWRGGFFVTRLRPDDEPPVILWARAVAAPKRALISWLTNEPSNSFVSVADNELFTDDERITVEERVILHQVWVDVEPRKTYYARVRSTDGSGNSSALKRLRFRTPPTDAKPPVLVGGGVVVSRRTSSHGVIGWVTSEAASSRVDYGLTEDYGSSVSGSQLVQEHSVLLSDLEARTLYHFRVISTDASGNEMVSADQTFITRGEEDRKRPAWDIEPHVYEVFHNSAILFWKANEEARGQIEFGLTRDFGHIVEIAEARREQHYPISGLSPGTVYHCRVLLTDLSGNGPTVSKVFTVRTADVIDTEPPVLQGAVRVLRRTDTQITVVWDTDEPSDTELEYGTAADDLAQLTSDADLDRQHRVTITDLDPGTTYYLRPSSTDTDGNTVTGELTAVTTRSGSTERAVRIISGPDVVVRTADKVVVEWLTDLPATSVVEYGTTASFDQEVVDGEQTRVHRVVISGLLPGTRYSFQASSAFGSEEAPATSRVFTATTRDGDRQRPPRILHAVIEHLTARGGTITWRTDRDADAWIDLGDDADDYTHTFGAADLRRRHQVLLSGLRPGKRYHYRLRSTDGDGNRVEGPDRTLTTEDEDDRRPPRTTVGPTVDVSHSTATFVWRTDEPCYGAVVVGTDATLGSPDEELYEEESPRREHRVTVTGLRAGLRYLFNVVSTDLAGNASRFGNRRGSGKVVRPLLDGGEISFVTATEIDAEVPVFVGAPTQLSRSDTETLIGWETDEVSDTRLFLVDASGSEVLAEYVPEHGFDHQVLLTDLQPGTTYTVVAASSDPSGNGPARSAPYTFTTSTTADTDAPRIDGVPEIAALTDEAGTVAFTADEAASAVVRFQAVGQSAEQTAASSTPARSHQVALTGLSPATSYRYRVELTDGAGNRSTSAEYGLTTPATADLAAPVIVAGPLVERTTPTTAVVFWTTSEGADGFVHFGREGALQQIQGRAEPLSQHRVELTNLSPGTVYQYRIASADAWGNGPTTSATLSLTTPTEARVPPAPSDLVGRPSGGGVVLTWTGDVNATGYNVYRARGTALAERIAGPVAAGLYLDDGVGVSDAYTYFVAPIDSQRREGIGLGIGVDHGGGPAR